MLIGTKKEKDCPAIAIPFQPKANKAMNNALTHIPLYPEKQRDVNGEIRGRAAG